MLPLSPLLTTTTWSIVLSACQLLLVVNGLSCPSESPPINNTQLYGSKRPDGKCETFSKVDWDHYASYESQGVLLISYLNDVFCKKFLNGLAPPIGKHPFEGVDNSWASKVDSEYILLNYVIVHFSEGNIDVNKAHSDNPEPLAVQGLVTMVDITESKVTEYEYNISVLYNPFPKIESFIEFPSRLKWMEKAFVERQQLQTVFGSPNSKNPMCPYARLQGGEVNYAMDFIPLQSLVEGRKEVMVKCVHDAYEDCLEETVLECVYNVAEEKWLDRHVVVKQKNTEPYGKPCSNRTTTGIEAKECNGTCVGLWSEWSESPNPECGNFTLHRLQGIHEYEMCGAMKGCCVETKTVSTNFNCEDFILGTNINLKLEKCQNNRSIIEGPEKHLMCDCGDQYSGHLCEIDKCKGICRNNGTCIVKADEISCRCTLGFEGSFCETILNTCGTTAGCQNGGTCINISDEQGAHCVCAVGFKGLACEEKIQYCTADSCNNNGVCHNLTETQSFKCNCNDDFTGKQCELVNTSHTKSNILASSISTLSLVILAVISALVFLSGGIAVVIKIRMKKKKKIADTGVSHPAKPKKSSHKSNRRGSDTQASDGKDDKSVSTINIQSVGIGPSVKTTTSIPRRISETKLMCTAKLDLNESSYIGQPSKK